MLQMKEFSKIYGLIFNTDRRDIRRSDCYLKSTKLHTTVNIHIYIYRVSQEERAKLTLC